MSFLQNIIEDNNSGVKASNPQLDSLYMQSEIALFKAKLLKLQDEAANIMNDTKATVSAKEKKMDKTIKKSKQLMLDAIEYIFTSPLKQQEFILQQNNDGITLRGQLGSLLYYFAREYGIDMDMISQRLRENHQYTAIIDSDMSLEQFIHTFDIYYYRAANDDTLL